jgi:hypothetical protein
MMGTANLYKQCILTRLERLHAYRVFINGREYNGYLAITIDYKQSDLPQLIFATRIRADSCRKRSLYLTLTYIIYTVFSSRVMVDVPSLVTTEALFNWS